MSKTLEGMARTICLAIWDHDYTPRDPLHPDIRWLQAMKAARAGAGFLADNVSDEMTNSADDACDHFCVTEVMRSGDWQRCISAALRASAGVNERGDA